jgi:hypothetical protein
MALILTLKAGMGCGCSDAEVWNSYIGKTSSPTRVRSAS